MPINFDIRKYNKDISVYVETGFFEGESVQKAIDSGFKNVHSCDINKYFLENGKKKFDKEIQEKKLFLHFGRSIDVLKKILENLDERAIFFLDAHDLDYENTEKNMWQEKDACPIIDELEVIKNHKIKNHILLIDDIRMFDYQCIPGTWAYQKNINISKIAEKIKEINQDYNITFERGYCDDDVLVAYFEE